MHTLRLPPPLVALCCGLTLACNDPGTDPGEFRAIDSMTLRPAFATIQIGQSVRLTAELHDADGELLTDRTVTWTSSAPEVAVVASGLVTGVDNGQAVIAAAADGRSDSARITVQLSVAEVRIEPESPVIVVGSFVQLKATPLSPEGVPLTDRIVRWTTLNPTVAGVSVGKVTGRRPGTAEIVATVDDRSASIMVQVFPNTGGPPSPPSAVRGRAGAVGFPDGR